MLSFSTNAWCSTVLWSYWHSLLDLDCVPTIPQTTECQVYLQTIPLHLAALFGELFPQKCKHHYPWPSMGKSDRVGCIQDTKIQCARLKSKQPDELKRSALCGVLKSDEMLGKHVRGGYSRHYSLCLFSLQPTESFCLFFGGLPFSSFLHSLCCLHVSELRCPIVSSSSMVLQALSGYHFYFIWCLFS